MAELNTQVINEQDNIEEVFDEMPPLSPGENNDEEAPELVNAVNPADNAGVSAVLFIFASLGAAQHSKGGFSMDDCERIVNARNALLEFYAKKAAPSKEVFDAYVIFNNSCQFHQKQGAFSLEGSVKLKQNLTIIDSDVVVPEQPRQPANRAEARSQARQQPRQAMVMSGGGNAQRGGPPVKRGGKAQATKGKK